MMNQTIIASAAIQNFVSKALHAVAQNSFCRSSLPPYASLKMQRLSNEVMDSMTQAGDKAKSILEENQPDPLSTDTLLPISADIEQHPPINSSQLQNTNKIIQDTKLSSSRASSNRTPLPQPKLIDEPSPIEQEDSFETEMRKNVQNSSNNETSKKTKISPFANEMNSKNGGKQENFSYNEDGSIIKIPLPPSRAHLVGLPVHLELENEQTTREMYPRNLDPCLLEGVSSKKGIKKVFVKTPTDIEFSAVQSLLDQATISKGVKVIHNSTVLQQKPTRLSVKDLKNTLSERRLSKSEYCLIKESTSPIKYHEELELSGRLKSSLSRTSSEPHLSRLGMLDGSMSGPNLAPYSMQTSMLNNSKRRVPSIIHISSHQLRQSLLVKATEPMIYIQRDLEPESRPPTVSKINKFNMDYIKTGGSIFGRKSNNPEAIVLPLLRKTQMSMSPPKQREKARDTIEQFRVLRKKFEDKLRQ